MNEPTKELLLGKLLLVLSGATAEKLAAVYQFATRDELPGGDREARASVAGGGRAYVFRWTGRDWEVVCGGGRAFHLPNVLGARYLNYLLHTPNEPIWAFDLEVAVRPEKAAARCRNSIQAESDARARQEYREALRRLGEERDAAREAGEAEEEERLDREVEALERAIEGRTAADTGERAFDNVRKAIGVVLRQLSRGGASEQAFAEHLRTHLSIGFECLYSEAEGRIWG